MLRKAGIILALLAGFGLLSGCGFKPLYGVTDEGSHVADELSYVAIPERRDRLHQLIRNQLLSTMSPAGSQGGDRYRLEFIPQVDANNVVIEPDGDVSRRLYKLAVDYRLLDNRNDKVLHQGRTFSHLSYDRVRSEFANIEAEKDISERASIQVADDIRTRLAAYFASR